MNQSTTNDPWAAKVAALKGCKPHGLQYRFHSTSSLCMHPDCLEGVIATLCAKTPSLRKNWEVVTARGEKEDFVQFCAMCLLRGKDTGKVMGLSSQALYYIFCDWNHENRKTGALSGFGMVPGDTDSHRPTFSLGDASWKKVEEEAKKEIMNALGNEAGELDTTHFLNLVTNDPVWGPWWTEALIGEMKPTELFAIVRSNGTRKDCKPSDVVFELSWLKEMARNFLS